MKRLAVAAALVVLAVVAWWLRPSEIEHATVPARSNVAEVPPPPEVPRVRPPRVRDETPPPAADAESKPDAVAPPTAETSPTKFPVTVTVLRSDGTPAKGAAVELLAPDDDGNPSAAGNTDDEGRVTLRADDDPVRVVAWLGAEAGAPQDLVSPKTTDAVTVRLGPSVVVRGRVLMDGKPVWEADVTVTAQPWFKSDFGLVLTARTNAGGEFETSPIPEAGIDPLNPPGVEACDRSLDTGYAETHMDALRRGDEVVVELRRAFTVRARFVDAEGKPARAELCARGSRQYSVDADVSGRVALRLPHGAFRFLAIRSADRSYLSDFDVEVATPPMIGDPFLWRVAASIGETADGASDVDFGDVVLTLGHPVNGVVVDSSGSPAVRAPIWLYLGGVRIATTATDEHGAFVLPEVGPDAHRLSVYQRDAGDPASATRRKIVDGVKGGDRDLRIVLDDVLTIVLHFLSETDRKPRACANYSVRVKLHGEGFDWYGCDTAGDEVESTAFEVLCAGSYDVEVNVTGYEPVRFESVEVVAGREASLDLLLRKKPN